jgi:2-iminoacetate synthase
VSGPKRDFRWRLEAPERGALAGMAFLGVGALLGLSDWRVDAFYVGLHARYLQRTHWRQHVSVSFPRMRHAAGAFDPAYPVGDAELVQVLCALRLFLPDAGMVLSTRESAAFRDHILPLGITRLSAGSKTTPGGYAEGTEAEGQFEVQDHRSLAEVMAAVQAAGFDPVVKDWDNVYHDVVASR